MRIFPLLVGVIACAEPHAQLQRDAPVPITANERVVGKPCQGCELVFVGKPTTLKPEAHIVSKATTGTPMEITGVVRDRSGQAIGAVIVYAYQTGADGVYPNSTPTNRHGDYRGWVATDETGRYRFRTVRPGSYPVPSAPPQHIHMHIVEPGRCTYYIADIEFTDDPRFRATNANRGGAGVSTPTLTGGVWRVRRDIVLGANVPGYAQCSK